MTDNVIKPHAKHKINKPEIFRPATDGHIETGKVDPELQRNLPTQHLNLNGDAKPYIPASMRNLYKNQPNYSEAPNYKPNNSNSNNMAYNNSYYPMNNMNMPVYQYPQNNLQMPQNFNQGYNNMSYNMPSQPGVYAPNLAMYNQGYYPPNKPGNYYQNANNNYNYQQQYQPKTHQNNNYQNYNNQKYNRENNVPEKKKEKLI